MPITVHAKGFEKMNLVGADESISTRPGRITAHTVFLRVPKSELKSERTPVTFTVTSDNDETITIEYESMFFGPKVY
jgi:hypothetical protein